MTAIPWKHMTLELTNSLTQQETECRRQFCLVAKHTNPEMFFTARFFLWKCYVHGLGCQKMPDANLHNLGNLHNQAN